jgi:cytochrome c553
MQGDRKSYLRRWGSTAAFASVALVAAALLFAWSGVYNISATRGHWPPIKWFLHFGMQSSVRTHAIGIETPGGYNEDQVVLGAGHYHASCASCHGAPGLRISEAARRLLPPPPDLTPEIPKWRDRELFWIVKNGIKYTGMPGWITEERDDEVWAVVAFLKRYPSLDAQSYRRLAFGPLQTPPQTGNQVATLGALDAAGACGRCHGAEQLGPVSKLVPALHGQSKEFLVAALEQFSNGARSSGIMQPIAAELTPDAIEKVAAYYAALPALPVMSGKDDAIARGRTLAESGDHAAKVPPCAPCHGATALPAYPRLAGQNAPYLRMRLKLWNEGLAANTDTAAIMAPIARALTADQIDDLATYYASQKPAAVRP